MQPTPGFCRIRAAPGTTGSVAGDRREAVMAFNLFRKEQDDGQAGAKGAQVLELRCGCSVPSRSRRIGMRVLRLELRARFGSEGGLGGGTRPPCSLPGEQRHVPEGDQRMAQRGGLHPRRRTYRRDRNEGDLSPVLRVERGVQGRLVRILRLRQAGGVHRDAGRQAGEEAQDGDGLEAQQRSYQRQISDLHPGLRFG